MYKSTFVVVLVLFCASQIVLAQETTSKVVPSGAKVFIAPISDGFDSYLRTALVAKKVPLALVDDKASADFEISGHSESQKASTAKKVIMWNWQSNEQASIQVINLKTSEVVFAYSANKVNSAHGKKSTAEACAKHLKEKVLSKK